MWRSCQSFCRQCNAMLGCISCQIPRRKTPRVNTCQHDFISSIRTLSPKQELRANINMITWQHESEIHFCWFYKSSSKCPAISHLTWLHGVQQPCALPVTWQWWWMVAMQHCIAALALASYTLELDLNCLILWKAFAYVALPNDCLKEPYTGWIQFSSQEPSICQIKEHGCKIFLKPSLLLVGQSHTHVQP